MQVRMMNNTAEMQSCLEKAARRVLEDAAFVFTESVNTTERPAGWKESVIQASLPYSGPVNGCFIIAAPPELGAELAASILGLEPDTYEAVDKAGDALAEILNMLAGIVLEDTFQAEETWQLGVPRVKSVSAGKHYAMMGQTDVKIQLNTEEGGIVEVGLFLHKEI